MNDWQLITEYVEHSDETAFSTLVRRHLDFVFSIAMRRIGRGDVAEETVQAVFLLLARKAGTFNERVILPSWLYRATCLIADAALRTERTRQQKEKEAVMTLSMDTEESLWTRLAPQLDEAMVKLSEQDRQAIVLRFFQKQSIRDTAAAMHLNEDAAKKRIARAIEKLRSALQRNRVTIPVGTLGTLLAERSIQAAPISLELSTLNAIHLGSTTASPLTVLAKAGARGLLWNKAREIIMPITAALILGACLHGGMMLARKTALNKSAKASVSVPLRDLTQIRESSATQAKVSRDLALTVIDDGTGKPLEGVQIRARFDGPKTDLILLATDVSGACLLHFPQKAFDGLSVWAFEPHHVGKRIIWESSEEPSLPTMYCVRLNQGQHLEGTVLDSNERPVPDARVALSYDDSDSSYREAACSHRSMSFVTSDNEGKWMLDFLPAKTKSVKLFVTHPDFARLAKSLEGETIASNLVLHLEPGVQLAGTIMGERAMPVVDGVVSAEVGADWPLSVQIEADGHFNIPHLPIGNLTLTVTAPGYSEVEKKLGAPGEIDFQLIPHKRFGNGKLRGRVVNETGEPIAGIYVGMDGWQTQTDEQGRFAWDAAPDISGEYHIGALNFEQLSGVKLAGDAVEHEIVLKRQPVVHLRGTVVDADTKQLIKKFRILSGGMQPDLINLAGGLRFFGEGTNGNFDLLNARTFPELYEIIQIESEGYQPERVMAPGGRVPGASLGFKAARWETDQEFYVELKRAGPIAGVVLLPDLGLAHEAGVALTGPGLYIDMQKPGRFTPGVRTVERFFKTETDGRFSLPQTVGADRIVVAHEAGFATLRIADLATNVVLKPWGRVEGILMSQGVPAANQEITLASDEWTIPARRGLTPFSFIYDTHTDAEGRFSFSKVPEGSAWVMRRYSAPGNIGVMGFCQKQQVQVLAGGTATALLGKSGCSVRGQFFLNYNNQRWLCRLNVHRIEPIDSNPFE